MKRGAKNVSRKPPQETLSLTIAELSPGGDGVAIHDEAGERRAVFVPGVALGEDVRAEVDFSTRPARGRLLEVIRKSPDRTAPPCAEVERCGGCDWMHLTPDAQLRAHAAIVEGILPPAFAHVSVKSHATTRTLGYRTRTRVHVDAKRGKVVVGMYGRRSHDPVPVDTCVVLDPALDEARRALAGWLEGAKGYGEAQLSLGHPRPENGPRRAVLELQWTGQLPPDVFARLERAAKGGPLSGARIFDGNVSVPATIGDPTPWIEGADDAPLRLAPGGFSQATEEGNTRLARRAAELAFEVSPNPDGAVLELYSGAGNLTVLLAKERKVVAVESDRASCQAARTNLEARGLTARVVDADASTYALPSGTKLVVIDPPRTGARDVAKALATKPIGAVVYVSCDPPTLGRDLAILAEGGYELRAIETFEMFPQTSHVETVAALFHPLKSKVR